ncbi:hypothetical protein BKA56DRAFT_668309 [Ilyonectria sp. MPI-CAGE-AT-0026]|nr:hypothetical protein BKA56DRAFT_668309 [Ilyonectria sp. MPI-CAGE-AT-0026]
MKSSIFIFTALATSFTAAEVKKEDYFPECSIDCLNDGTEKATDCSATDAVCWCVQSNYEAIYNQALACVLKECGADKATESVLPAAIEFCSAASSSTSALGGTETGKSSPSSSIDDTDKTSTIAIVTTSSDAESTSTPSSSTSGSASTPTSDSGSASGSDSGAVVSTTASTDAAAAMGTMGVLGMLVMGAVAAL